MHNVHVAVPSCTCPHAHTPLHVGQTSIPLSDVCHCPVIPLIISSHHILSGGVELSVSDSDPHSVPIMWNLGSIQDIPSNVFFRLPVGCFLPPRVPCVDVQHALMQAMILNTSLKDYC